MLIAKINQDNSITVQKYQDMFPLDTFPVTGPNIEFMESNGCKHVSLFLPHNQTTEKLVPSNPYLAQDGIVYLVQVVQKTQEEINEDAAIQQLKIDSKIAANVDLLWQAADKYQSASINGVVIGLLTIGVLNGLPKAVAIKQWCNTIWNTLYYPRKLLVTDVYDPTLYDFSSAGDMPYSIPELDAEVTTFLTNL